MATIQLNQDFTRHMTQILPPHGSRGGLYLGDQHSAATLELLNKKHITLVITVAAELDTKYPAHIAHHKIDLQDHPLANIHQHFEPTYALLKKALAQGNVLVHCRMGISRSASLVIAYLMRKYKCGFDKAYTRVKDRRGVVNPNQGFVMQLRQYDKQLREMMARRSGR